MNKKFVAALVVVAILATSGLFFPKAGQVVQQVLGASAGPRHIEHQIFVSDVTVGGGVHSTTTTVATETLTAAVLEKNKVIRMLGSATAAAITVTLPATSTIGFMPRPGDTRTWIIENGYTAAATTTTIAAGTGIDLQEPDGQNVVIGINNYAYLTCHREVSTDIVCLVDESIPAD